MLRTMRLTWQILGKTIKALAFHPKNVNALMLYSLMVLSTLLDIYILKQLSILGGVIALFARERNVGWRIDYFVVSNVLKDQIVDAKIFNEIEGSDHCPVLLELK